MADLSRPLTRAGSGRHVVAASLAVVASIIVHGLLLLVASRVDLNLFAHRDYTPPERQYPQLELGRVEISTEVAAKVLNVLREIGEAIPPDVTVSVGEMQVAPELGLTDPPALKDIALAPELAGMSEPEFLPANEHWMPRQEILAIETVSVGDQLAGLERQLIPSLDRVMAAPDIVPAVDSDQISAVSTDAFPAPAPLNLLPARIAVPLPAQDMGRAVSPVQPEFERELFEEQPDEITDLEPVERVLTARVETFGDRRDSKYTYFRLVVERAGAQLLPVRPKDILLVQDSSASMAENRLFFCREAMRRSLALIGPGDRFNVAKFSDHIEFCFPAWVTKTTENLAAAETFINSMEATGNTDLFASMQSLLELPMQTGRPVLAFVMTDGFVNSGVTDSTDIIGAFTHKNQGRISVFTMGVSAQANRYLLDLLSYCNSGATTIVETGRWDIPVAAEKVMQGIQRPVLADVALHFGANSSFEVYPQQIGNLYLDQPLVLYGRCLRDQSQLVFQALGQAGTTRADMIFDLPLAVPDSRETSGDASIRVAWGHQKLYHLLGAFARTRDKAVLKELRKTAREYGVAVPYRDAIGL